MCQKIRQHQDGRERETDGTDGFTVWTGELCKPELYLENMQYNYSFSQLFTHIFWKHTSYSQNSTHKSKNTHTQKAKLLQSETLRSELCNVFSKWYFVFKWHTQTIIWKYISKNQLNTDVLNGKHYYEWKTLVWMSYQETYASLNYNLFKEESFKHTLKCEEDVSL